MKKLSQKRLADTILNGRKQKGLTQQKLAELTGINRTMLSHMETEEYMPSIPQLEALASVLEFDVFPLPYCSVSIIKSPQWISCKRKWIRSIREFPRSRMNTSRSI